VDDAVLALLWLTSFEDHDSHRAWKSHDWDALERLHQKGFISDPSSKAKSVVLTDDGTARSREVPRALRTDVRSLFIIALRDLRRWSLAPAG
jgi:hypothetical protein